MEAYACEAPVVAVTGGGGTVVGVGGTVVGVGAGAGVADGAPPVTGALAAGEPTLPVVAETGTDEDGDAAVGPDPGAVAAAPDPPVAVPAERPDPPDALDVPANEVPAPWVPPGVGAPPPGSFVAVASGSAAIWFFVAAMEEWSFSMPAFSRAISAATTAGDDVVVGVAGVVPTEYAKASPVVPSVAAVTTMPGTVTPRRRRVDRWTRRLINRRSRVGVASSWSSTPEPSSWWAWRQAPS